MCPVSAIIPRRGVLAAAAGLGLLLAGSLSGCSHHRRDVLEPAAPDADQLAVDRAVASARQLRANALALTANPTLAPLLRLITADHEAHLRALGAEPPATGPGAGVATTGSTTPTPTAGRSGPTASLQPGAGTPGAVIAAEWAAARTALRDGESTTPVFAVLLCRIAAARASHADLLSHALGRPAPGVLRPAPPTPGPAPTSSIARGGGSTSAAGSATTPATSSGPATNPSGRPATNRATNPAIRSSTSPVTSSATSSSGSRPSGTSIELDPDPDSPTSPAPGSAALTAVNRLLAGQHAAVFVYPVIIARAAKNRTALARSLWQTHLEERNTLTAALIAAGVTPVPADPAYAIGTPPATAAATAALAARVEGALAALAADVIADAATTDRDLGADQLVRAARAGAGWTGKPAPFPGLSAQPSTTAATTNRPTATATAQPTATAKATGPQLLTPSSLATAQPTAATQPTTGG